MFDGKAFAAEVIEIVKGFVSRSLAPIHARLDAVELQKATPGLDGKDGEPGQSGRDGADGAPGRDGADGRDGQDGKDGANGEPGRDGADGAAGRDGRDGVDGRNGEKGVDGKDGVGVAGALIDRGGSLVLTLADGRICELGAVVGKDGDPGRDGADGRDGQDGAPGRDGQHGLGFDDLTVEHDGERGFSLVFTQGDRVKRFDFFMPCVIDRGVYRDGETYVRGDAVTWAGSLWIARQATSAKPDAGADWRLSVKRGRDGRDGRDGERGLPGLDGPPGRDLTQLGHDGAKW